MYSSSLMAMYKNTFRHFNFLYFIFYFLNLHFNHINSSFNIYYASQIVYTLIKNFISFFYSIICYQSH